MNQMRKMGGCVITMEHTIAPRSITTATNDLLVVLICDDLALWRGLAMRHTAGNKGNGQHDIGLATDEGLDMTHVEGLEMTS